MVHRATLPPQPWFFEEFLDKEKKQPTGNITTIYPETKRREHGLVVYDGLGRSYPNVLQDDNTPITPNQLVTLWTVYEDYLQTFCQRVSEKEARRIHPRLFEACMDAELAERAKLLKAARQHSLLKISALIGAFLALLAVEQFKKCKSRR